MNVTIESELLEVETKEREVYNTSIPSGKNKMTIEWDSKDEKDASIMQNVFNNLDEFIKIKNNEKH